jgi:hypothetical protein
MSPTVPISRFVDEEYVEPSPLATQPTVQRVDDRTDWEVMSPSELAVQIRAQLEDCGPLSPAELAGEQRIREEIRVAQVLDRARQGKPDTHAEAKPCRSDETVSASKPSRNSKWRPRTAWAKEYQRLYQYPYPPDFYVFRCGARTRAGTPCKRRPDYRNGRCKLHGGASTGPKTEQGRRQSAENGRKGGRPRKRVAGQESKT